MFVKIKNFFIMLGYKLKRFSLGKWFGSFGRKQWIITASVAAGVIALTVAIVLFATLSGGAGSGGGTGSGAGSGAGTGDGGGVTNGGEGGGNTETVETISSIYISANPYDCSYYVNETADWRGLSIGLRGENLISEYVSYDKKPDEFTITGFDSSAPKENQVITVTYKGHSTTFTVDIVEVPEAKPTLVSIRLDPMPKATCKIGKIPDTKEARLVRVYSDGTEKTEALKTKHFAAGYEDEIISAKAGDLVTITVLCSEDGITAETTFTVTMVN